MTESFLRSDLPSMGNEAGAGGEALQRAPIFSVVGSRNPLCVPVRRLLAEPFGGGRHPDTNLSVNS